MYDQGREKNDTLERERFRRKLEKNRKKFRKV